MYEIPTTVQIAGQSFAIRNKGDYRMVLDCFAALNDTELSIEERVYASLIIFYEDMQTLEDTSKNSTIYYSSTKIIEGIFKVLKDKAIIPVSVGLSNGTRTDYLYNKVDVLISAILEKGYKIVPVSQLDIE